MKKLMIFLAVLLSVFSCKGPGSGPLAKESFARDQGQQKVDVQNHKTPVTSEKVNVKVEPCSDCITISKLLGDRQSYSGKVIRVKGQVTKFNPGIMGKNWVHIQDGTEFQGGFDLTVTTDINVSLGQTITFEGKIALDKDFGYGYFYKVIMEEGKSAL